MKPIGPAAFACVALSLAGAARAGPPVSVALSLAGAATAGLPVSVALSLAGTATAGPPVRGPYLVTALPSVGSVRWSCTASSPGLRMRHRISFTAYARSATDMVTFRLGKVVLAHRLVQPGETLLLPWTRARTMTLELRQATEARTLQVTIAVDFGAAARASGSCRPYLPPELVTRLAYRR
jgi:hypothetical protein